MDIDFNGLDRLHSALADVIGYLTDNSCGDPDCCGGPFYEREQFEDGLDVLAEYGLNYTRLKGE